MTAAQLEGHTKLCNVSKNDFPMMNIEEDRRKSVNFSMHQ